MKSLDVEDQAREAAIVEVVKLVENLVRNRLNEEDSAVEIEWRALLESYATINECGVFNRCRDILFEVGKSLMAKNVPQYSERTHKMEPMTEKRMKKLVGNLLQSTEELVAMPRSSRTMTSSYIEDKDKFGEMCAKPISFFSSSNEKVEWESLERITDRENTRPASEKVLMEHFMVKRPMETELEEWEGMRKRFKKFKTMVDHVAKSIADDESKWATLDKNLS